MPRFLTRGVQVAVDIAVLSIAFWFAFLIRFEFAIPPLWLSVAAISWPFVLVVEYGMLIVFSVPKYSWRFISIREATRIGLAITLASAVLAIPRITDSASLDFL